MGSQYEKEYREELFRFTPNWVTDTWNLPSGDLKSDLKQSDFEFKVTSCTGCKSQTSYDCIECPKRDFGLDWLPEQYYDWSEQEIVEWKLRMGRHGSDKSRPIIQDN